VGGSKEEDRLTPANHGFFGADRKKFKHKVATVNSMRIGITMPLAVALFVSAAIAQQNGPANRQSPLQPSQPDYGPCGTPSFPCRQLPISFGSALDADKQIADSATLAKSLEDPQNPQWRAKGDQHRTYKFGNKDLPYRIYAPLSWDGQAQLPLVLMLHGAGSDENRYLDDNGKLLLHLAEEHGYLLVSPLGYGPVGAYGTPLRLPAVFGQPEAAAKQRASVTQDSEHTLELSEQDVINVLELVLNEYPVDQTHMFLTGHSMGGGGTWYLGAKYHQLWRAIAPMSGPFVDETNYPWENIRTMPILMSEGTKALPSVKGSYLMRDWMIAHGFDLEYVEVDADHPGMVPLALPAIFDFFDRYRNK
jgi:poly(3-hydroxybutyrate) depolymerase